MTPSSPLPLLVLRHAPWEGLGSFTETLQQQNITYQYIDVAIADNLPPLERASAIIALGGPQSVYDTDRYPYISAEISAIARAVHAGIPYLGICLGSQLLAAALGASVQPNPHGPEIGWSPISLTSAAATDPLFRHFAPTETVLHWHGDSFSLPDNATLLASSATTPVQAFRYQSSAWGLLFHLEPNTELIDAWLAEPLMQQQAFSISHSLPWHIRAFASAYLPRLTTIANQTLAAFLQASHTS